MVPMSLKQLIMISCSLQARRHPHRRQQPPFSITRHHPARLNQPPPPTLPPTIMMKYASPRPPQSPTL
jgi:hypothetical protein